jgi:CAAX protease family protein
VTTPRVLFGTLIEALLLTIVLAILHIRGWNPAKLGLRFSAGAALSGLVLFVWYLLFYWATWFAVVWTFPTVAREQPFKFVMSAHPAVMILFIVFNSFFEEIVATGYVITALSRDGAAVAISASTLLRFAYHLYQGPLSTISILPLGILFGIVFWKWRSLWPMLVAHTALNLMGMLVLRS